MKTHTLIFLGPSGCGKGTQVKKTKEYLQEKDGETPMVHLTMGDLFRDFWEIDSYSANKSKEIVEKGDLQPGFLQVKLWSEFFVKNIKSTKEHLIIDGSPRRILDAKLMESAFDFYKREKPTMVFLETTMEESKKRLIARGRKEDLKEEVIDGRLSWYKEFVIPSINYFKDKEKFNFVHIDANPEIDEVWKQIKEKVFDDFE